MRCRACGNLLTRDLIRGVLGGGRDNASVKAGTFAVDPLARTIRFWMQGMPEGETNIRETDPVMCVVVHPDDRIPDALSDVIGRNAGCCGLDGCDGPNQQCSACGAVVATARTDCWTEHEVRFLPARTVLQ